MFLASRGGCLGYSPIFCAVKGTVMEELGDMATAELVRASWKKGCLLTAMSLSRSAGVNKL